MKKIAFLFLTLVFFLATYSQEPLTKGAHKKDSKFAIGIDLAPALTLLIGNFTSPFNINSKGINPEDETQFYGRQFGIAAGLSFEYFINKYFSLKSGLEYQRKGAKTNWNMVDDVSDYIPAGNEIKRMNFDYLTIPFTGSFFTKGKFKFYLDGGTFVGFLLSQKDIYSIESQPKTVIDNTKQVKRFDFGLSLGLGFRIPLSKKWLFDFGLCQNTGLISINKTYLSNNDILRTSSTGLQFGIKYRL